MTLHGAPIRRSFVLCMAVRLNPFTLESTLTSTSPLVMPAKAMLFDQRVRTLHDFGASPVNFISFNPQGRLLALAGFGNLAGKMDIFDRRSLNKVCVIDAPNTSHCEWSPDGRFLLTATLSPRLRVDNGIKIWHCSGPLLHVQPVEELYQASWRPTPVENVPGFGQNIPPAPAPTEAVKSLEAVKKPTPMKAAGAYRPPGARGLATPAFFKREDEGGAPRMPSNGSATPPRPYSRSPAPPGSMPNGNGNGYGTPPNGHANAGRRQVPGAAHSPSPGPEGDKKSNRKRNKGGKKEGGQDQERGAKKDGAKGNEKGGDDSANASPRPSLEIRVNGNSNGNGKAGGKFDEQIVLPPQLEVDVAGSPVTPGLDSALDPVAKKVRNLNKKVRPLCVFSGILILTSI